MGKQPPTIFVADDDLAILEAITLILEDEGYQVITSPDIETASAVEEHQPDVLLLDIWMAGIDGSVICQQLKQNRLTRHIPIIMVSANRDTPKIAQECGADDFLTKPFETEDLLAKVAKHSQN